MFDPSSQAIVWILAILVALMAIAVLISIIAVIFVFTGAPDRFDVDIVGSVAKKGSGDDNKNSKG